MTPTATRRTSMRSTPRQACRHLWKAGWRPGRKHQTPRHTAPEAVRPKVPTSGARLRTTVTRKAPRRGPAPPGAGEWVVTSSTAPAGREIITVVGHGQARTRGDDAGQPQSPRRQLSAEDLVARLFGWPPHVLRPLFLNGGPCCTLCVYMWRELKAHWL